MSTKTNYTPGPWEKIGGSIYAADVHIAYFDTMHDNAGLGAQEGDANARLIAAAPELVEALRNAASLLGKILYAHETENNGAAMGEAVLCEYFASGARHEIAAARAALAKAGVE